MLLLFQLSFGSYITFDIDISFVVTHHVAKSIQSFSLLPKQQKKNKLEACVCGAMFPMAIQLYNPRTLARTAIGWQTNPNINKNAKQRKFDRQRKLELCDDQQKLRWIFQKSLQCMRHEVDFTLLVLLQCIDMTRAYNNRCERHPCANVRTTREEAFVCYCYYYCEAGSSNTWTPSG